MSLDKVLITGSSKGLGAYLAQYFSSKGHSVLLHGRDEERLKILQGQIVDRGGDAEYKTCDLSRQEDLEGFAAWAKKKNVGTLINNAAVTCYGKKLQDLKVSHINDMIDTNLKAPIVLIMYLKDSLKNIININSMVGLEVKRFRTLYSASKWGLRGFANSLKLEMEGTNILDVYPTNMETWPGRENSMDINFVLSSIYGAYLENKGELVLDGREEVIQ